MSVVCSWLQVVKKHRPGSVGRRGAARRAWAGGKPPGDVALSQEHEPPSALHAGQSDRRNQRWGGSPGVCRRSPRRLGEGERERKRGGGGAGGGRRGLSRLPARSRDLRGRARRRAPPQTARRRGRAARRALAQHHLPHTHPKLSTPDARINEPSGNVNHAPGRGGTDMVLLRRLLAHRDPARLERRWT